MFCITKHTLTIIIFFLKSACVCALDDVPGSQAELSANGAKSQTPNAH